MSVLCDGFLLKSKGKILVECFMEGVTANVKKQIFEEFELVGTRELDGKKVGDNLMFEYPLDGYNASYVLITGRDADKGDIEGYVEEINNFILTKYRSVLKTEMLAKATFQRNHNEIINTIRKIIHDKNLEIQEYNKKREEIRSKYF